MKRKSRYERLESLRRGSRRGAGVVSRYGTTHRRSGGGGSPQPPFNIDWTLIAVPVADRLWLCIARSAPLDVIVVGGCTVEETVAPPVAAVDQTAFTPAAFAYSLDGGLTFTSAGTIPTMGPVRDIIWSDVHECFIAVGARTGLSGQTAGGGNPSGQLNTCATSPDGVTWTPHDIASVGVGLGPFHSFAQIAELSDGTLILTGSIGSVTLSKFRRSTDGGETWELIAGQPYAATNGYQSAALITDGDRAVALMYGNDNALLPVITDDGGDTFTETAATPDGEDDIGPFTWARGTRSPTLGMLLECGYEYTDENFDVYRSVFFISLDNGETWSTVSAPTDDWADTARWIAAPQPFFFAPVTDAFEGSEMFASYDGATWYASAPGVGTGWLDSAYDESRNRIVMVNRDGSFARGSL